MPTDNYYECSLFIPFHLADPAGILFFGHVFTLAHQSYEQFVIDHLKVTWTDWFKNPEWVVPIKHAEAEYFQPILAGQTCRLFIEITSVGNTSFTLKTSFYQDRIACSVNTVHVFFHPKTKNKMAIPSEIASRLSSK